MSHLIEARPPAVPALLRDAIRRGIHGIYTGIRGGSALDLPPPLPPPGNYQVHYLFNGAVSAAPRRRIKTLHYAVPWVGFGSCFVGRMRRRRRLCGAGVGTGGVRDAAGTGGVAPRPGISGYRASFASTKLRHLPPLPVVVVNA